MSRSRKKKKKVRILSKKRTKTIKKSATKKSNTIKSKVKGKTKITTKMLEQWILHADKYAVEILKIAYKFSVLKKKIPYGVKSYFELQLVDQKTMKRLNQDYRGVSKTTDVLSFPIPKPFISPGVLGVVVICLPVMKRQAKRVKNDLEAELAVLMTHGFLHLLGFDHERNQSESQKMAYWEKKILEKLFPRLTYGVKGLIGR